MRILTTSNAIEKEFKRLLNAYDEYYWAVAWAGIPKNLLEILGDNTEKIKKLIFGLHFYQTHPDFIEKFLTNNNVKYIKQPSGTFHPKIYVFSNSRNDWEILLGSFNFTASAFISNAEVGVVFSSKDDSDKNQYKDAIKLIEKYWNKGNTFTITELNKYRDVWDSQSSKIKSLAGLYGNKGENIPLHQVEILNMSWTEYLNYVMEDPGLKNRILLLETANKWFSEVEHYRHLDIQKRKAVAGIFKESIDEIDWLHFGSMMGAGYFKNKIINNDKNILKALDQIPLKGNITKYHYSNFISYFCKSFTSGSHIATSTRLLAIKRPDVFVCFDSKNKRNLCNAFGIKMSGMTYVRYWEEIIERIFDSQWWQKPAPRNELELQISSGRSAMLDSIYYDPD